MNIITTFWKQSFVYGIGSVIVRAVSFILLPLYTNFFNEAQVGHIFLLFAFIAFAQIFYNHGLDSSFLKYYSDNQDKDSIGTTLITSLYITSLFLTLLIILVTYFLQDIIFPSYYTNWLYYCSIILFFDATSNRILTILRIQNRSTTYLTINIINVIVTLIANFIFIVNFNLGVDGVLLGTLIGSVVRWVPLLPTTIKILTKGKFSNNLYKKCLKFGLPFLPAAFFYIIMEMSDRYFLLLFLGAEDVGIYSIGYKIGSIGMLIITAFNLGWQPFYNQIGSSNEAKNAFAQIGSYFMFFIISLSMMIIIWTPTFMRIKIGDISIIGSDFWVSYQTVPIILFAYIFYAFYIISMPSMYIYEKQAWSPIFRLTGALSNVLLNIILIPIIGILGAAISTAISYLLMTLFIHYKSSKWMQIPYKWDLIIKQVLITVIMSIVFINIEHSIANALYATIIYLCSLLICGFHPIILKIYKQL